MENVRSTFAFAWTTGYISVRTRRPVLRGKPCREVKVARQSNLVVMPWSWSSLGNTVLEQAGGRVLSRKVKSQPHRGQRATTGPTATAPWLVCFTMCALFLHIISVFMFCFPYWYLTFSHSRPGWVFQKYLSTQPRRTNFDASALNISAGTSLSKQNGVVFSN